MPEMYTNNGSTPHGEGWTLQGTIVENLGVSDGKLCFTLQEKNGNQTKIVATSPADWDVRNVQACYDSGSGLKISVTNTGYMITLAQNRGDLDGLED
jgi:hypothetical protein